MMQKAFGEQKYIQAPALRDFYKCFHEYAYQDGVEEVLINFTARFGKHTNIPNGSGTYQWAGLQAALNTMVEVWNEFFAAPKAIAIADYKRINEHGLGAPCDTSKLEQLHDLGYLPLEFRGLLEGVEVPYGVAAFTCRNTHPDFFFLPNAIETFLSAEIWPVQTSLTTATEYMRTVVEFASKDGTPEFLIPFLGHDFSMRGMMGAKMEAAAGLSGMGHLMSGFVGSDTLPAGFRVEKDYGAYLDPENPCTVIASVPATEHSVQCSFDNNDIEYFRHCMKVSPEGILSLVSDGYDFWALVTKVLPQLKDEIMERNGKIVIRPDSGDPADIICGYNVFEVPQDARLSVDWLGLKDQGYTAIYDQGIYRTLDEHGIIQDEIPECEVKGLVETLYDMFGGTETEQGFKLLDEHIGTIYGDSITLERQRDIYERLHAKGFAIANVVLGIGSYTYQYVTRDTHGSAVKATNMIINGVETPIAKEVATDVNKKSAKGRLVVTCEDDGQGGTRYEQLDQQPMKAVEDANNCHGLVWKDGEFKRVQTLTEVRERVAQTL